MDTIIILGLFTAIGLAVWYTRQIPDNEPPVFRGWDNYHYPKEDWR